MPLLLPRATEHHQNSHTGVPLHRYTITMVRIRSSKSYALNTPTLARSLDAFHSSISIDSIILRSTRALIVRVQSSDSILLYRSMIPYYGIYKDIKTVRLHHEHQTHTHIYARLTLELKYTGPTKASTHQIRPTLPVSHLCVGVLFLVRTSTLSNWPYCVACVSSPKICYY